MKFLIIPWIMASCWANGISEANVGQLSGASNFLIRSNNGVEILNSDVDIDLVQFNYQSSTNTICVIYNLPGTNILPYINSSFFELWGIFSIGCPRTNCSIFTMGFGYVVIPFIDNAQVGASAFTGSKLDNDRFEFIFNMVFNDPTLATAESHVYRIEFWDCEWGQCELDEYDKKTVKRGEAIMTVNYTP
jgi:hypothetical protein